MKRKKLALSLSGGGARAFCYAGVIHALKENDIPVDHIYAHSGAAILLCFMATNPSKRDLIDKFSKFRNWKFTSFNPLRNNGLVNTKRLIAYLNKISGNVDIKDLVIKTTITTTDVTDFDKPFTSFHSLGNLAEVAVASSSIPLLYPPFITSDKHFLVDGGFSSVYSAKYLRSQGADIVIGCYPDALHHTKLPKIIEGQARLLKSINTLRGLQELEAEPIDLEIKGFPTNAGLYDYSKAAEMFQAGYDRTLELLPKIKKLTD